MYDLDKIVQYSKNYGFIYQGSEIYDGLANTWDYGPLGSLLKENIKKAWKYYFVQIEENNVLLDSSILLNTRVWQASGHLSGFNDPLIENRQSNQRYRADKLIKDFDSSQNPDGWTHDEMYQYIIKNNIKCPVSKTSDWLPIRSFNMMFKTSQGVVEDSANTVYLRPETAQGIFINFKNIARTTRKKIPFGVAQIGKSFRNEITPGNFIFRTREFEQMELEFFCKPGSEKEWFDYWSAKMESFLTKLGISNKNIKLHNHSEKELSHYSNFTTDILYNFPWGFDELWGIASRTNFDLSAHEKESGKDLSYLDQTTNEKYIPYVVEPSVGVERLLLAFLKEGLVDEELENGSRTVFKIHPYLAPYKVAVLPLMRKNHEDFAKKVFNDLSIYFDATYDVTQNIGKRYRRQDAIGTPYCITIDDNSLENNTVTLRERDSMEQITLPIDELVSYISSKIKF